VASSPAEHAILGLLALAGGQGHGYDLARHFAAGRPLAGVIRIEVGMLYHHLKQLARAGWVAPLPGPAEARPARRVFALTDDGRAELWRWLGEPVAHTREIRLEFLVKLALARRLDRPAVDADDEDGEGVVEAEAERVQPPRVPDLQRRPRADRERRRVQPEPDADAPHVDARLRRRRLDGVSGPAPARGKNHTRDDSDGLHGQSHRPGRYVGIKPSTHPECVSQSIWTWVWSDQSISTQAAGAPLRGTRRYHPSISVCLSPPGPQSTSSLDGTGP